MSKIDGNDLALRIVPHKVTALLVLCVVGLTLADLLGAISIHLLGHDRAMGLIPVTRVGYDSSIPTWFASVAFLLCAGLLALIAAVARRAGERDVLYWVGLSALFLLFSVDDVARLHEVLLPEIVHRVAGSLEGRSPFLYYSWVILGGPAALIVGLIYLRFVLRLPARVRNLFFAAAATFIAGALGMEMLAARIDSLRTTANLHYALLTNFEEFLEMMGTVIFAHALMSYLTIRGGGTQVQVTFGDSGTPHHTVE